MGQNSHFRRWGAIYLLLGLFIASWLGQFIFQMVEFKSTLQTHNESFSWSEYIPEFLASTFENWQSEWLQLVIQGIVLLALKHLIFKAEAADEERLNAKLDSILEKLNQKD